MVRVSATLNDGRTVSAECRGFKGSAVNPMNRDERMDKIWDCIGRALPKQDAQKLIDLVEDLENVTDISALMRIIGKKSPVRV